MANDLRIEWKDGFFRKIVRSSGMASIMENAGNQVCRRANSLASGGAEYGMKVTQGRGPRAWKARIYTANYKAMKDAADRGTLTKVI